jgi:Family of unknown function (DUF6497)
LNGALMTDTLTTPQDRRLWPAQAQGRVTLPGDDTPLVVPSGQGVTLHEVIVDTPTPDAAIFRFRYLAPAIARSGGTMDFESSISDMQGLCETHALARLTTPLREHVQVIISFADIAVPFGETNPEATQFFMAFDIKDGQCILEPY